MLHQDLSRHPGLNFGVLWLLLMPSQRFWRTWLQFTVVWSIANNSESSFSWERILPLRIIPILYLYIYKYLFYIFLTQPWRKLYEVWAQESNPNFIHQVFVVCLQQQLHILQFVYIVICWLFVCYPQVVNVLSTQDFHIKLPNGRGFEKFHARRKNNWPCL